MNHDLSKLPDIFARYPREPQSLIAVLQDIQKEFNFLPCEALKEAAQHLDVPLSKVFSVSTFYNAFSLNPKGEKVIRICMGTTCHIRGAALIQDQLESKLGINASTAPNSANRSDSINNCRMMRKRPPPMANRMAISRCLSVPCALSMFARFRQDSSTAISPMFMCRLMWKTPHHTLRSQRQRGHCCGRIAPW